MKSAEIKRIHRRTFIKAGMVGTATALIAPPAFAEVLQQMAASDPATFPKPVYRTLGRTGLKISVVSFGAMLTPEPEVIRVAIEQGVNYIDTARKYMNGKNEEIVAKAVKGLRDKVYLATKTLSGSKTKVEIIRDVETSLKTLETDHIDVIQLHNVTDKERIYFAETREALTQLKKQGKVRFCGVTTHKNEAEVLNALVDDKDRFFDTCLVKYNFKSDKDVSTAIERASAAGIGIIAMKTQAGGYDVTGLGKISPHQAALKWVLQNPRVTMAIPGMRDMTHLREDIAVMGMPFTYVDLRRLDRYSEAIAPFYCSFCGNCEAGCPNGVEISTVNRALMYAEGGYRDLSLGRATYAELPMRSSAAVCLDCEGCAARCVNGLDISAKMGRARELLA
ncbi:MAG: aldo/keto reductase [Deltaproteobacteria bacterium]|nr:aldo/keto reductase [Deltaproteobacteria bacterium]